MNQNEILLESTESYLCELMSEVANLTITSNDASTPFLELGIDSFRVLQIIKKLEEVFGTLPKTLLFENFNISDLSNYFVEHYEEILEAKFENQQQIGKPKTQVAEKPSHQIEAIPKESIQTKTKSVESATPVVAHSNAVIKTEEKGHSQSQHSFSCINSCSPTFYDTPAKLATSAFRV